MTTELLAPLDLAFWHLESPDHPMHLGALAVFDAAPGAGQVGDDDALVELLATRAAAVPRLRMRVRDVLLPVGGAAWIVDKDFDVRRHVRHLELPPGDFAEETARAAGELMERPLERGIPPWEMYVLTGGGAAPAGRSFAVLVKLHHALADGMRAVAIGAGIFDQIADARAAGTRRARPAPPRSWLPGPWQVADRARDRIGDLGRALGIGASVVRASRLDLRATTALVAGSSGTRRLATAVLALEDVRRVRKEHGGTVNDVLLATVTGAMRRWMLERGERLPDSDPRSDPRALVPVSGRRPSRARHGAGAGGSTGSGNVFSAYLLGLPVSEPDPLCRLTAVREAMDRNKKDGPSRGAGAVAVLAGQLHPLAHRLGAPLAGNAARMLFDVLVTSVPLPRATLSFGGCPLREIYPMAPLARGQSLAVGLTTYGGQVHVGLVADGKAVPDLSGLAQNMTEELHTLLSLPPAVRPIEAAVASGSAARAGRALVAERVAPAERPAEAAVASGSAARAGRALVAERVAPAERPAEAAVASEVAALAGRVLSSDRAARPNATSAAARALVAEPVAPAELTPAAGPAAPAERPAEAAVASGAAARAGRALSAEPVAPAELTPTAGSVAPAEPVPAVDSVAAGVRAAASALATGPAVPSAPAAPAERRPASDQAASAESVSAAAPAEPAASEDSVPGPAEQPAGRSSASARRGSTEPAATAIDCSVSGARSAEPTPGAERDVAPGPEAPASPATEADSIPVVEGAEPASASGPTIPAGRALASASRGSTTPATPAESAPTEPAPTGDSASPVEEPGDEHPAPVQLTLIAEPAR